MALRVAAVVALAAAIAAPFPGRAQTQTAPARAPAFSAKSLTAPPTDAWLTNGGNIYNQRYSPLARINRGNVAQLKPRWRTHLNGSGLEAKFSGQAQPIVYDGVIYVATGANDVFALDVDSGKMLWTYEAHLDPSITVICCGWMSRGVAIADGKIFTGQLDGKLVALDQVTGKVVWQTQAEKNSDGFSITT
ncbi:MAG TPA: PQQ-binding-like beta-propeller repeat protein, partial [Gammaproteobacteria bacterium]|nr:PQQ-binding-like beta-propeller repeat protein [Gammaproteobacteria bacterium]